MHKLKNKQIKTFLMVYCCGMKEISFDRNQAVVNG